MVSAAAIRVAFGVLGNVVSIILYLSPTPTFVKICKKGSVENYSATPYLMTLFCSMTFLLYGLPIVTPNSFALVTICSAGCLIELVFLLLFLIYSGKRTRIQVILILTLGITAVTVLAASVLSLVHATKRRSQIVGSFGIIASTAMYASPLTIMKLVIRTRSVEYMPFFLSLAAFSNAVIWFIYAIHPFDLYIAIPNSLGSLLGLAQLILYAVYYKSTQEQLAARKAQNEMGLAQIVMNGDSDHSNVPSQ
ncbi:hypothetical protein Ancab_032871 [Ancistrocladus abbreviatus]